MKETTLVLILIFTSFTLHSQIKSNSQANPQDYDYLNNTYGQNEKEIKFETQQTIIPEGGFNIDCETDFMTINISGNIQQWKLAGGQIFGGDIILSGGQFSLAYCQYQNAATFFSDKSDTSIQYYDYGIGWLEIPAPKPLINNGGVGSNQYFMAEINTEIYHFDEQNFTLIDVLPTGARFLCADIAVDHLGRAWVFVGQSGNNIVESLRVYDASGLITSYDVVSFNAGNCAGSMFLDGTLYIGFGDSGIYPLSIVPVINNGGSFNLGTPVYFPQYINLYDLASCNENVLQVNDTEELGFHIYPNPTNGKIYFSSDLNIQKLEIYNLHGNLLVELNSYEEIDLSKYSTGVYYLRIFINENIYVKKVIKN